MTTPPKHHPGRLRLNRAGIVNVWYYYDTEFTLSGGRLILRGSNGSGKSRALEMLLPFLLDGDRRRMDATGSGKVRLEDLMRTGAGEQHNRLGYLWLELTRSPVTGEQPRHLTLGAQVRFSASTGEAKVRYFVTPLRVGTELPLLGADRMPLSRDELTRLVGADQITDRAETHRERVQSQVFGLTGHAGKDRYAGLLELLRTLRSPDVGNRIEEGRLPQILSDALPPLSEAALAQAGERLDGLTETRAAQQRLATANGHLTEFLRTYRKYATGVVRAAALRAQRSAGVADDAMKAHDHAHTTLHALVEEHTLAGEKVAELSDRAEELSRTIDGIRDSTEYAGLRDLEDREAKVTALGKAADTALLAAAAARLAEEKAAADADDRAGELADSAERAAQAMEEARSALEDAGMTVVLPVPVGVTLSAPPTESELIRTHKDTEPESAVRRQPLSVAVAPADPSGVAAQVSLIQEAAKQRGVHAVARREQAAEVEKKAKAVESAEERAADAAAALVTEREAEETAWAARDDAARALGAAWRVWVANPQTVHLLPGTDWEKYPISRLLQDPDALCGDEPADDLTPLDQTAQRAAEPARTALSDRLADLRSEESAARAEEHRLTVERDALHSAVDPDPPTPGWVRSGEWPLWRAVEFADSVPETDRAGLEGALLASGLLTATVTADGSVTAADGDLLVRADGPLAARSADRVLVPVESAPPAVAAILGRIALGDPGHPVSVGVDGTWRNGPLHGRHHPPMARYVGAAARAAARAARLAEIAADLARIAAGRERRRTLTKELTDRQRDLNSHVRTAPTSHTLTTAHALAKAATTRAAHVEKEATRRREAAQELRAEWSAQLKRHRAVCADFGLPSTADELSTVIARTTTAIRECRQAVTDVNAVGTAMRRHASAMDEVVDQRRNRTEAETRAEGDWSDWHAEASRLAATRATIGADAARIKRELAAAELDLKTCRGQLKTGRAGLEELAGRKGAAEAAVTASKATLRETERALDHEWRRFGSVLRLPGLAEAALDVADLPQPLSTVTPGDVRTVAEKVVSLLRSRPSADVDETAVARAQQTLERELAGGFDIIPSIRDGVHTVAIADGTGRHTVVGAAAELRRRHEEGQAALSSREQEVFTEFVLGGIADELRQRLGQAEDLIRAMNESLKTIHTSHGIGVRLHWRLTDAAKTDIGRIRRLVSTADVIRTPEQSAELTELLKNRVGERFALDESAGYTTHLREALDYRAWHEVEVVITGPEPGRERKISRRAKLSQGETRFVSYVALFAAADAYLSGLPDASSPLRLLLLDDAFAKVDDQTIAVLMGLLVRLDIDFVMTGHALWGCYPEVPSLDCYEIRRGDDSPAATIHIHWDGRNKHLRATG
ncbi:TIGR02680 family protein [Herbidospora sp. NBRC 101105]|uniref:TIGR02680 family protein n=1 Tax=Herbidospora sp. NBRC 101105 TaxID=3032195 RepID=UPI0024A54168|nr:TIGR02680 family protein [Herbidospora sp. NBRC 101105]GLX97653.1 hypothetical protein Hesp01_56030 [Herbidospora sp. NBRC 101105]